MKQGVVLLQGARGEAVRPADEAEANLEAHQSLQDLSDLEHNNALQELTASKVSHTFAWLRALHAMLRQ